MRNQKILLIARSGMSRAIMRLLLDGMDYKDIADVMSCSDGMREMRLQEFVLVITEVETDTPPNGFDVIRLVRELGQTKVILLLDWATAANEDGGFAEPPDAVLGTPFTPDEFEKVVRLTLKEV